MTIFSPMSIPFFAFLFFSTLLPMDPPQDPTKKTISIAWGDTTEKNRQLGIFFALLPQEIIFPYFLIESEPAVKNGLRKTNTTFSALLSWENRQPFMLCKELCASEWDIKSIIISCMYQHRSISRNPVSERQKKGIISLMSKLETQSYPIVGDIDGKSEYLQITDLSGTRKIIDKYNYMSNLILVSKSNSEDYAGDGLLSPVFIACIERNSQKVAKVLAEIKSESFNSTDFQRSLHICIQNNDIRCLDSIIGGTRKKNPFAQLLTFDMASKLMQLAVFCASDQVIPLLGYHYIKLKNVTLFNNNYITPIETNYIKTWLNVNPQEDPHDLSSIIKCHRNQLQERNVNNLPQLQNCLNLISHGLIRDLISDTNKHKNKNEKCIIS